MQLEVRENRGVRAALTPPYRAVIFAGSWILAIGLWLLGINSAGASWATGVAWIPLAAQAVATTIWASGRSLPEVFGRSRGLSPGAARIPGK